MLVWLGDWLSQYYTLFNVFHYITFRAIMAALTALIFTLVLGPKVIAWLHLKQMGQPIRDDGPQSHFKKAGTPTMGGVLILSAILSAVLLWADVTNRYVVLATLTTMGFGLIGWVDDYKKLILKNSKGLKGRWKYLFQSLLALLVAGYLYYHAQAPIEIDLLIPFAKLTFLPIGMLFIVLAYFVIVGTSNAVNLTDGLDGLAILPVALVATGLGAFAYVSGNNVFADYLSLPFISGVGELTVFCAAIAGAGLGFLWFNAYPAQIIMGDVGALSLGAALGCVAVMIRQELILFIMGGVFVMETLSVILQVVSFKSRGKRIFKMAPIHHHFELIGWPEPKVITRFWIMTVICVLIGLSSLKLR